MERKYYQILSEDMLETFIGITLNSTHESVGNFYGLLFRFKGALCAYPKKIMTANGEITRYKTVWIVVQKNNIPMMIDTYSKQPWEQASWYAERLGEISEGHMLYFSEKDSRPTVQWAWSVTG